MWCCIQLITCVQWSLLGNDKVTVIIQDDCYMYIQVNFSVENKRQLKILGSCPMTVIYMVTATYRAAIYRSTLQKYKTTENFEKLSGDHNIQSDHYIQVNFAENKSQLKILGNCPVTLICGVTATYRAAIYRFDCTLLQSPPTANFIFCCFHFCLLELR